MVWDVTSCDPASDYKAILFRWNADAPCAGGETLPATTYVHCALVGAKSTQAVVLYILAALGVVYALVLAAAMVWKRDHTAIRSASITFCLLVCLPHAQR